MPGGSETPRAPETSGGPQTLAAPRLGAWGWARWAWRQLTSMRTALSLLLLLAVAAVPGSILPQTSIDPTRVDAYRVAHPQLAPWLGRLGFFHVYSSAWFAAVYLLLAVSLVGCIVPRCRVHATAVRSRPPRAPRRFERLPTYARAELGACARNGADVVAHTDSDTGAEARADADLSAVLGRARAALRSRRFRVVVDPAPGPGADPDRNTPKPGAGTVEAGGGTVEPVVVGSVCAERGYLAETGNLLFHLALLVLLVVIALGNLMTWSGQALVVVGDGFSDVVPQFDSLHTGPWVHRADLPPFSFSLNDVRVRFDTDPVPGEFGAPRDFAATLTVRSSPGAAPRTTTVRVNDPLTVGGTRVFLVGNGYAPVITVRDGQGRVAFSGPVPFLPRDSVYTSNGVVKVPDARPTALGLVGFLLPTAAQEPDGMPVSVFPDARDPRLLLTAWAGDLGLDSGVPQSVYTLDTAHLRQLKETNGTPFRVALAVGQRASLPEGLGSVSFDGVRRYAVFDLHDDPTKGWVLAAALTALAGIMLSLFVRRRRIWVKVLTSGSGPTVVEVAGLARGEDGALLAVVRSVLEETVLHEVASDEETARDAAPE